MRASSLDGLPHEIEVLANDLCDISRAEFEIAQDVEKRALSYLAIGAGPAMTGSINSGSIGWVANEFFTMGIAATASLTASRFSVWLQGIPIGKIKTLLLGGTMNISRFWGVGGEAGFIADDLIHSVFVNYYAAGIKIQPRHELSVKVLLGGSSSGLVWLWDATDPGGAKEEVAGFSRLMPPATYSVELLYRLSQRFTVLGKVIRSSLQEYTLEQHIDPLGKSYSSTVSFIALQMEFPIKE